MTMCLCSDLHMGDGSKRDDFRAHADRFEESLLTIPKSAQVVLVGDIVDIWRYDFLDVIQRYCPILEMLADLRAIWIAGNHDADILKPQIACRLPPGFVFTKRIVLEDWYICHGDEFDLTNSRWYWIGEAATKFVSALGKASPWLEDRLSQVPHRIKATGRHTKPDKFRKHAYAFVNEFMVNGIGLQGIVCGHTHQAAREPGYVNTGTWPTDGWTVL